RGAGVVIRGGVSRGVMVKDESIIDEDPQFLQTGFRARRRLWHETAIGELVDGMSPIEFMLRFAISHPDVAAAVVGTANPEHLMGNAAAAAKGPLPPDVYEEARRRFRCPG